MVQVVRDQSSVSSNQFTAGAEGRVGRATQAPQSRLKSADFDPHQQLANQLAQELWSRLPIARFDDGPASADIDRITRVAGASHAQIAAWYSDFRGLTRAIIKAATETRGEQSLSDKFHEKLASQIQEELTAKISFPLPPTSFVDYQFADLPPAEALRTAHKQMTDLCKGFVNDLLSLLNQLQQQNMLGKVSHGESTCQFTYYRRAVLLKAGQSRNITRSVPDLPTAQSSHPLFINTSYERTEIESQHRDVLHTHHVRSPVLRKPSETIYPVPQKYLDMIDECPDWMRSSLRILEGDLFRQQRIEHDVQTETRVDEVAIATWVGCPAVVLGNYVLAGWSEREIQAQEKSVQKTETAKQAMESSRRLDKLATGLGLLATITVAATASSLPLTFVVAILSGVGVIFMTSQAAHLRASAAGEFSAINELAYGLRAGCFLFALLCFVYAVASFSFMALVSAILFLPLAYLTNLARNIHRILVEDALD